MPLLGHRAPFNAPPFRTQHTVKNVVLTGGRDVASCEARVAVVCWRTVYSRLLEQSDDHLEPANKDARATAFDHTGKNPDLTWLCNEFFGANSCSQTSQGCLWLFPGANITRWHRDFDEDWQLLTGT